MKKVIIAVIGLLCVAPLFAYEANSYMQKPGQGSLFGGNQKTKEEKIVRETSVRTGQFGIGLRAGIAQNDPKTMKEIYDEAFDLGWSEKELTKGNGVFGLEAFYEWDTAEEANKVGLKVGVDFYGQNKLKLDWGELKATENTHAFPLTFYFKRDNGIKSWSFLVGAGLTIIDSELEVKPVGEPTETYSKTKVFPHVTAGAEYRFNEVFALGLDVKYNIAAKVKKDGDVLSDRSGIGAALTGRFYF